MKAVVHIGLPKAGSSTLQDFLHQNADALDKQGFCYRRFDPADMCQREYLSVVFQATGRNFDDPVQSVAAKMRTRADVAARADALDHWIDAEVARTDADVWLISNEFLSSVVMRFDGQAAIHDWLTSRFDHVRYVIYLRSQDSWAVSMYSQKLRDGFTDAFPAFLSQTKPRDYAKLANHWAQLAGTENLSVRLLDRSALDQGDLILDFCSLVGIDANGLARPAPRNTSYTRRCADAVRTLNSAVGRVLPRQSPLSRAIRKAGRTVAEATLNTGAPITLTPTQREALLGPVAKSNEALRKRWFAERPTLFDPTPSQPAHAAPAPADPARVHM